MTDDELAHAWESFATALADVPRQRDYRERMNFLMRPSCLSDLGSHGSLQDSMQYQHEAMRLYEQMRQLHNHNPYVRGIRPGPFGLGITL